MASKWVVALAALMAFLAPAGAKDWWGAKLADEPTQFIFGYGSLINSASRNSTAGAPTQAIPVRVSAAFGYIRTWSDRSASGFTALGLRKPGPGEKGLDDQRRALRRRGQRHGEVRCPRAGLCAGRGSARRHRGGRPGKRLPQTGTIWVYVPVGPNGEAGVGLPAPDAQFPLLESYIDVVVEGGLEYGEDFARELIETTVRLERLLAQRSRARPSSVGARPGFGHCRPALELGPGFGGQAEVAPVLRALRDPLGGAEGAIGAKAAGTVSASSVETKLLLIFERGETALVLGEGGVLRLQNRHSASGYWYASFVGELHDRRTAAIGGASVESQVALGAAWSNARFGHESGMTVCYRQRREVNARERSPEACSHPRESRYRGVFATHGRGRGEDGEGGTRAARNGAADRAGP